MTTQKTSEPAPEVLDGRYQIIRELGRGAQGRALLAEDLNTGTKVVLKELDFGHIDELKLLELFEREARALKSISHPNIPAYIDEFHLPKSAGQNARFFLVQEFIEGENLRDLLASGSLFDESEVRRILAKLLPVLDYLHTLDPPLVHRDIKPSNIILRAADGAPALVDFGGVHQQLVAQSASSTIVGTSGYMPLEQLMGRPVPASDLYALGAAAIFLLSRTSPDQMLDEQMTLEFEDAIHVSAPFLNYLKKLLAPSAGERFQSAKEALKYLKDPDSLPPVERRAAGQPPALMPAEPLPFKWSDNERRALLSKLERRMTRLTPIEIEQINFKLPDYTPHGRITISYRSSKPRHAKVTQTPGGLRARLKPALNSILRGGFDLFTSYHFGFWVLLGLLGLLFFLSPRENMIYAFIALCAALVAMVIIGPIYTPRQILLMAPHYFFPSVTIKNGTLRYLRRSGRFRRARYLELPLEEIDSFSIICAQHDRPEKRIEGFEDPVLLPNSAYRMEVRAKDQEESFVIEEDLPLDQQFYILGELWHALETSTKHDD